MKKTLVLFLFIAGHLFSQNVAFVHPLDFKNTEVDKEKVLKYIVQNVKDTYSKIGMDSPSTLRMMEAEELDSFKKLSNVTNRTLLDKVIVTYCNIGMCNYSTIWMMYNEESQAEQQELKW